MTIQGERLTGLFSAALTAACLWAGPLWAGEPPEPIGPNGLADPRDAGGALTDVTARSGLADIVEAHYARNPKWWLSGLHLVDLNGNGRLDFFMSAHGGGGALAALNDGTGRFTLAQGDYPRTEIHLAYDSNEDGRVDLTMTFQDGGGKWWLNRSEPGTLRFEGTSIERGTNTARRQAMIDLNRDGHVDWLRGLHSGTVVVEWGDGRGGFTPALEIRAGDAQRAEVLCLPVDLNGNGHIDLVTEWGGYGAPLGNSRIFRNDGRMNFTDVTEPSGLSGRDMSIKGVADVNHDGLPDLLVLENRAPEIYLNDGRGRFARLPGAISGMEGASRPTHASWGIAVATDFDNDGRADILWNGKHFLWVLRGTGGGRFEYVNRAWAVRDLSASSVDDGHCFGDIDGDGRLDIVGYTATGPRRRFAVYRNDLPPQNWLRVRPVGLPGNRGAAGAKIRLYEPGTRNLLWYEQVAIFNSQAAQSYYSFAETERHFGLGRRERVDVEVEFHPSQTRVSLPGVEANATVRVEESSGEPADRQ
jgi:hypothetical protein